MLTVRRTGLYCTYRSALPGSGSGHVRTQWRHRSDSTVTGCRRVTPRKRHYLATRRHSGCRQSKYYDIVRTRLVRTRKSHHEIRVSIVAGVLAKICPGANVLPRASPWGAGSVPRGTRVLVGPAETTYSISAPRYVPNSCPEAGFPSAWARTHNSAGSQLLPRVKGSAALFKKVGLCRATQ
jgi:hypothetical protein